MEITTTNTYISQATRNYNILPMYWINLAQKPCQKNVKMAGPRDKEKNQQTAIFGPVD
jgi:hypothetical protein